MVRTWWTWYEHGAAIKLSKSTFVKIDVDTMFAVRRDLSLHCQARVNPCDDRYGHLCTDLFTRVDLPTSPWEIVI